MSCDCYNDITEIPSDEELLPKLLVILLRSHQLNWAESRLRIITRNYWMMQEVIEDKNDYILPSIERAVERAFNTGDPTTALKTEIENLDILNWKAAYGEGDNYTEWDAEREPLDVFSASAKKLGRSVRRWEE